MVVDLETEAFLDVDPAASETLGYAREERLSIDPEDIHPNHVERVRTEFISQVSEERAGFTEDLTRLIKDGADVPTELSGAALDPTDDETHPQMIAMLRDSSERVEHRRGLDEKNRTSRSVHQCCLSEPPKSTLDRRRTRDTR